MKRLLLVVLVGMFLFTGTTWAQGQCEGCKVAVTGYLGPTFRIVDHGDGYKKDIGFGMPYNRVDFAGMMEVGPIVKKIGWKAEADFSQTGSYGLVYGYVQAYFTDMLSARFGYMKPYFGLEWFYPTYDQIDIDRLITPLTAGDGLTYFDYSYGLDLVYKGEMFSVMAGAYDGQGAQKLVRNQDPALDYVARGCFTGVEGLKVGAAVRMKGLPGTYDTYFDEWEYSPDQGSYVDSTAFYQTNNALAYEADLDYMKSFEGDMSLHVQGEFGMGDNYQMVPKDAQPGDEWEDFDWYQFQYFYAKALFMVTSNFGVHGSYASYDPNTDVDYDTMTKIPLGITYKWSKRVTTLAEVQLYKQQISENTDENFTNFALMQVVVW